MNAQQPTKYKNKKWNEKETQRSTNIIFHDSLILSLQLRPANQHQKRAPPPPRRAWTNRTLTAIRRITNAYRRLYPPEGPRCWHRSVDSITTDPSICVWAQWVSISWQYRAKICARAWMPKRWRVGNEAVKLAEASSICSGLIWCSNTYIPFVYMHIHNTIYYFKRNYFTLTVSLWVLRVFTWNKIARSCVCAAFMKIYLLAVRHKHFYAFNENLWSWSCNLICINTAIHTYIYMLL